MDIIAGDDWPRGLRSSLEINRWHNDMEEIKKFWSESMEIPEVRWIVALAGLVIVGAIGYYFIKLVRDMAIGGVSNEPGNYLSEFQKMKTEGVLEDHEYEKLAKVVPTAVDKRLADVVGPDPDPDSDEDTEDDAPDFVPDTSAEDSSDEN